MTSVRDRFAQMRAAEFQALGAAAYLNAAAVGPLPERSRAAMERFNLSRSRVHAMELGDFVTPGAELSSRAATLLGAGPDEIAFVPNTSVGINIAALGLQVPDGSRLLVSDREFPANMYPWLRRKRFNVDVLPTDSNGWLDEERFINRILDGGISIVALSSVQFDHGFRADLESIGAACRDVGAFFVIDAIQSLGVLPFNVAACHADVVATGGHKWLLGPFGAGFVYVRSEIQSRLEPAFIGWSSMEGTADLDTVLSYEWSFYPDARRYEVGTAPLQDMVGLSASLSLLLEATPADIERHVDAILDPLREWLLGQPEIDIRSSFESKRRSGIVAFVPPSGEKTLSELRRAGVHCTIREGAIRVAAHLYNTEEDIARLLEVLQTQARTGWG